MKIAIFGATGKTGQPLVRQALDAGYEVVALVRTPPKITLQNKNLRVIQGDILDVVQVEAAIQGVDAVLSVLGPSSNKPDFTVSKGFDNILSAMQRQNVRRIILTAGAAIHDPLDKPPIMDRFFHRMVRIFSKNVFEDMAQVVAKVRASDRDWTIVRVPVLRDTPATGNLKVGYLGETSPMLSREDLAAFMLKQLNDDTYSRKAPAISN